MLKDKDLKEIEGRIDALRKRDKDPDAERKVIDEVFDHSTLLTIYKMFTDGIIDTVEFSISTGKEANVFYATSQDGPRVVKIFRISTSTFHTISKYIVGDPRFERIKGDKRRAIFQWAQKEYKNLSKAVAAGVSVPRPYACRNNVLVMEYIGDEDAPAPLIKDVEVEDAAAVYKYLIRDLRRLYHDAGLVHCDLSEYNVLYHAGRPCLIDMGQAVLKAHPMAREFMDRDMRNLVALFKRQGLRLDAREVHASITEVPRRKGRKGRRGGKGRKGKERSK